MARAALGLLPLGLLVASGGAALAVFGAGPVGWERLAQVELGAYGGELGVRLVGGGRASVVEQA
jgi:hypothetical protein